MVPLAVALLLSRPPLLVVTRAATCSVLLLPIASFLIVAQTEPPEWLNPGAETIAKPDDGVSQTRTFMASASPTLETRST